MAIEFNSFDRKLYPHMGVTQPPTTPSLCPLFILLFCCLQLLYGKAPVPSQCLFFFLITAYGLISSLHQSFEANPTQATVCINANKRIVVKESCLMAQSPSLWGMLKWLKICSLRYYHHHHRRQSLYLCIGLLSAMKIKKKRCSITIVTWLIHLHGTG